MRNYFVSCTIRQRDKSGAILTIFVSIVNLAKTHLRPSGLIATKNRPQRTGLCGAEGIRTLDLYSAIVALSQTELQPQTLHRLGSGLATACHAQKESIAEREDERQIGEGFGESEFRIGRRNHRFTQIF